MDIRSNIGIHSSLNVPSNIGKLSNINVQSNIDIPTNTNTQPDIISHPQDNAGYFETNDAFVRTAVQKYMAPSVIALIGTTVTIVANSVIVGNCIGAGGLSALNIVNPIYFTFATLGALINVGASTNASVCIGKNEKDRADSYITLALWLTLALSVLVTAIGLALFPQLVRVLGATPSTEPYVREYGQILLLGGTSVSLMYYPFNFLKVDGRPRQGTYMFLMMFALDLLFNVLFLGVLNLGMRGVALSFVLSTICGDFFGLFLLLGRTSGFTLGKVKRVGDSVMQILKTGSSMALNNLCNIFRTMVLNYIILRALSEDELTVFAVIGTINNFSNSVISGIAQTITPLIGVFYGEKDNISMRTVVREAVRKGIGVILIMTAGICLSARLIGSALGVTGLPQLAQAVIMFAVSFLPGMLNHVYIFYYFTTEKIGLANILTFLRGFVVLVLSALCFSYIQLPGLIWLSFAAAEGVTLLVNMAVVCTRCERDEHLKGMLLLDDRYEEEERYLAFTVENTAAAAADASEKITLFCKEKEMSSKISMTIGLAVEEMLLIIFEHCLSDQRGQYADVRIMRMDKEIILHMRCAGRLFDPITYYKEKKAEAMQRGEVLEDDSLGIEMIVKQAQDVTFSRTFGTNNLTILLHENGNVFSG